MDSATLATPVATDLRQQVLALAGAVGDLEADQRDVAAVDLLGELESLKNTVAAAQARLSVLLRDTRVA